MSLKPQAEERSAFFIGAEEEEGRHELVLQKGNALASEDCLKEAIDWFSAAGQCGPVRPDQLGTLLECILRNFRRRAEGPGVREDRSGDAAGFDCPGCHTFLAQPVTVACGHSYCERCVRRRLVCTCRLCGEAVSGKEKANVTLCALLDKWFPHELDKSRASREADSLCRRKLYSEAVSLASDALRAGESAVGGTWTVMCPGVCVVMTGVLTENVPPGSLRFLAYESHFRACALGGKLRKAGRDLREFSFITYLQGGGFLQLL